MLFIRPFQTTDEEAVIALWQRCGLVRPWNNPKLDIERKLQKDPDLFLVGLENALLVASLMGGYEGHRGVVNYLAVSPDYQHKGYGQAMMAEIEAKLKARGCPKINLLVRSSNTQVIGFYEQLGYKQEETVCLGKRLIED
ncbi:MAG: GNAT family acetyltransferase [Deinococcales bacterium]